MNWKKDQSIPRGLNVILKIVIFNLFLLTGISRFYTNTLRRMPRDLTDDWSTLVQVMAWCCQVASHYLNYVDQVKWHITEPNGLFVRCWFQHYNDSKHQWNKNVIFMEFSSVAALKVVILTIFQHSQWWKLHQNDISIPMMDNLQCRQWWKVCQNDNSSISVYTPDFEHAIKIP